MKTIIATEDEINNLVTDALRKVLKEYIPAREIAKELGGIELAEEITGLKKPTIYSLTSLGKIPHMKVSSKLRFNRTDLMKWMADKNQDVK